MLLISDIHIGFSRSAGTTPQSQEALRTYLLTKLQETLRDTPETHLCILGDLFDTFEVAPRDWLSAYGLLSSWAYVRRLTLVAGNHDHSPKGYKVSSFQMLCTVLQQAYPDHVQVIGINEYAEVTPGAVALAHCSNQDIFDMKLAELLERVENREVLLHANYANGYTTNSDHSLNVSEEQAQTFIAKGCTLVFAHEHQARVALDGGVVVLGNQWPTSVADCLGNDSKKLHVMGADTMFSIPTWQGADDAEAPFRIVDWRELGLVDLAQPGFIRVTGDASRNEAAEVVNTIAKFRSRSNAFVVTNSVRIEGIVQIEELPKTFEAAKKFDVMQFIRKNLSEREMAVVERLAAEKE